MGKLIVIEGIDGTGKSTQYERLCQALLEKNVPFRHLSFPVYEDPSSTLVKMYLAGELGKTPDAVNPYAASTLYACDRFASFKKDWQADYEAGMLFVSCRYTTSNALHQGSKLTGADREAYLDWLFDFEYRLLGIPKPDLVCYLDLDADVAMANLRRREAAGGSVPDIHETDPDYLRRCAAAGAEAADRFGWTRIACAEAAEMRSRDAIFADLRQAVRPFVEE